MNIYTVSPFGRKASIVIAPRRIFSTLTQFNRFSGVRLWFSNVSLFNSMDNPEDDDIVRNKDGTVKNPFEMVTTNLVIFKTIISSLGFLLNSEIVLRIVYDTNLMRKPRYILQLSTSFSSMFTLFTNVVGTAHFVLWQDHHFCKFYILIVGWSYGTFLLNFLLSLIDCFVAITFPLWHRSKVDPRFVLISLIILHCVLFLAMKWEFIFGVVPLQCAVQISHTCIRRVLFHLIFFCAIFICTDYVLTLKKHPRSLRTIAIRTPNANSYSVDKLTTTLMRYIHQPNRWGGWNWKRRELSF